MLREREREKQMHCVAKHVSAFDLLLSGCMLGPEEKRWRMCERFPRARIALSFENVFARLFFFCSFGAYFTVLLRDECSETDFRLRFIYLVRCWGFFLCGVSKFYY